MRSGPGESQKVADDRCILTAEEATSKRSFLLFYGPEAKKIREEERLGIQKY